MPGTITLPTPERPARRPRTLPQLSGDTFLTDGGLETMLGFLEGFDLPHNAAFVHMENPRGREAILRWFRRFAELAVRERVGLVLETATWRASRDWAERLGWSPRRLADAILRSADDMAAIREAYETASSPMTIAGEVGPRGDGYDPSFRMSAEEAEAYHLEQVGTFADSAVDFVAAATFNDVEEAVGLVRAAVAYDMPVVVSFTVETDGRLPTGRTLGEAIARVDAETGAAPAYYGVNCAHPTHFAHVLDPAEPWTRRVRSLQANASTSSHAELDGSAVLDDGDPDDLAARYAELTRRLPWLNVLGGCCGTDRRHVAAIARACALARGRDRTVAVAA